MTKDTTTTPNPEDAAALAAAEQVKATAAALYAEDEPTTVKPVIVHYDTYAEPDELHPAGVLAGTTYEAPSPEVAYRFHPKGRILRYADGSEFNANKAKRDIRAGADS